MIYKLAADAVVLVHFAFIVFVVFGGLVSFKYKFFPLVHIPSAIWGALIEFSGWVCPLTPLEKHLREIAGHSVYTEGFLEHYIVPLIYPDYLTQNYQIAFASVVIIINIVIYGCYAFHSYQKHKK